MPISCSLCLSTQLCIFPYPTVSHTSIFPSIYLPIESTPSAQAQEFDLSHSALQTAPKLLDLTNFIAANLRNKWREIGIQLGIKTSTLDAIYDRRNRNPSQCFTDVFEEWERSKEVPYTWARLLEAIASPYVDEKPLAIEIRQKVIDKMNT